MRFLLLICLLMPFYSFSGCEEGDCYNGFGTYVWKNGDTDDRSWAEGDKYIGYFLNGKMHGQGTYSFFKGDLYNGSFINGMRSGYGTFIYKNGDKYDGRFLFDKKNGKGILTNKKGITKSVQYKLDRLLNK
jgi:hypothetical protein